MATKKILVVEDSPTFMQTMTSPLIEKGYRVITAENGEEALVKTSEENPDLIVLDVILPKKNGFQVCRQIKTTLGKENIKILLLTSKTQDSDRFWGLKQGADEYMTKPFNNEEYLNTVSRLLAG